MITLIYDANFELIVFLVPIVGLHNVYCILYTVFMITNRTHLRTDVTTEILQRLGDTRLAVGRINESELAEELGISRTPLREALVVMEQRGLIDSAMGRGFIVRPLHREEASELYPLLAVLEPMALRLGFDGVRRSASELRDVVHAMQKTGHADDLLKLSQRWGDVLLAHCPNVRLRRFVEDLHRLAARYERAALERGFPVGSALVKHLAIVDAIEAGDVDNACKLLGETWQDCLAALLQWLPMAEARAQSGRNPR